MSEVAVNHIQSCSKGTVLFSLGDSLQRHTSFWGKALAIKAGSRWPWVQAALGAAAFFKGCPYLHAVCSTELKVLVVTKETSRAIVAGQPAIALALMRELALQIPQTEELVFFQGRLEEKAEGVSAQQILPEGHPVFAGSVPVEYGELVFPVEVECRACQTKFTAMRPRTSRLQLQEQRPDFRNVYRNFEPNFFYIWVCPKCLFAYPKAV